MPKAFISGCKGTELTDEEKAFFAEEKPWGFIVFAWNCETPDQIQKLVADFRQCVGRDDAPVLIDQEGGRVQRLKEPHWRRYPAGRSYGELEARIAGEGVAAARHVSRLIADDLYALGINVDCLPILDVPQNDGHDIIGDRAYGETPEIVAAIGRAVCEGLRAGGVLPIIKHIPGHGRARGDSHHELPIVSASADELRKVDFPPFIAVNDMPMAMTAHIIYEAFDKNAPATQSKTVIQNIIRDEIGFDGLIMTDDLSMKALSGSFEERSEKSLEAGCDMILHCNGDMDEMKAVARVVPELTGKALDRAEIALAWAEKPQPHDREAALAAWEQAKLAV